MEGGKPAWQARPLADLATVKSGFAFKSSQWKPTGVPVVKIGNVRDGSLDMTGCSYVSNSDAADSGFELQKNDLVIGLTGYVGQVAKVRNEGRLVLNQRVGKFHVRRGCDPDFLFALVSNRSFRERVEAIAHGSAQPNVSPKAIEQLEVFAPSSLEEQRAIAAVLSALNDKIELNRRMNETLEASARALFQDWFVDFGPTRAKAEGRPAWLAPDLWSFFPDCLGDDGVPEGWEHRPVSHFAELKGGKQLDKSQIYDRGDIPVFGGAGPMGFTDAHNAEGYVVSVGRVGAYCGQYFAHRGKAWINNNASYIRTLRPDHAEWLFMALRDVDMDVIKKGAAQPFVSNGDIAKLGLMWAGDAVVDGFTCLLQPFILRIEANAAESHKLAATRDALLPRLMSGELRVRDAEALAA